MQTPQTSIPNANPATPNILGIDVYHGDGNINWPKVAGDPQQITFAYLKATQGTSFEDPAFTTNCPAAYNAGLKVGAYHFYDVGQTGAAQATYFTNFIQPFLGELILPPVLDFEPTNLAGKTAAEVETEVLAFLQTVAAITGTTPVIYTNYNSWVYVLGNPTSFTQYDLWVADYSGKANPTLFGGWEDWAFWQYTDAGTVAGINNGGSTDMDRYNPNAGLF